MNDLPVPAEAPNPQRSAKPLWVAIGALALAVAALGGVLLGQQRGQTGDAARPAATSVAALSPPVRAPNDGSAPSAFAPPAPEAPVVRAPEPVRAPPPPQQQQQLEQQRSAAAEPSGATPAPLAAPGPEVAPAPPPCAVCGHVESVRSVQREQPTTGVGMVAGGVVGGVLGNQIGHGNGRAAATVLGAVGGGYVGNTIEKRTRTVTRYEVAVRMDNGRLRTVETRHAPPIGQPVTLKGGVLRPAADRRRG